MPDWLDRELALWRDRLGLQQWRIDLVRVDAEELESDGETGVRGRAIVLPEYLTVTVKLATKRPRDDVRETLVHELCHCLVAPLADLLDNLKGYLAQQTYLLAGSMIDNRKEELVTRIARLVLEKHQ